MFLSEKKKLNNRVIGIKSKVIIVLGYSLYIYKLFKFWIILATKCATKSNKQPIWKYVKPIYININGNVH